MSDPAYAGPGVPYWLNNFGVNRVYFNKLSAPPLAELDKNIVYTLEDEGGATLYLNGTPVGGGGSSGDVSSNSKPCRDLAIPVFDGTTGEQIKQSVLSVEEPSDGVVEIKEWVQEDESSYRLLFSDYNNANTVYGLFAAADDITTNGTLNTTIIGAGAARALGVTHENSVYVGSYAARNTTGAIANSVVGSNAAFDNVGTHITAIGYNSLYSNQISYSTAIGVSSQASNYEANGVGIAPNTSVGAWSMKNLTKANGNNALGFRALEGAAAGMVNGPRLNNSMGNYNGLSATDGFENNIMIGNSVLNAAATALGNVIVGNSAGEATGSGSNYNIYLGNGAGIGALGVESRTIRIGASVDNTVYPYAIGKPNRCFIQGISGITTASPSVPVLVDADGQLGTISSSMHVKDNIRPIEDTSFLHSLEICNFEYKGSTQKSAGVIAEVVEQLKPELVIMQGNGVKTVDYQYMFVCALRELQKLKSAHDALSARVLALETPVELPPQ